MPPRLLLVAAVVAIAGALAALVLVREGAVGEDSRWRPVLVGVCRAAELAAEGDRAGADARFRDVHDDIHELIIEAGRSVGGGLARDKFRVEQALEQPETPAVAPMRSLSESIRSAGVAAGDDPGSCP